MPWGPPRNLTVLIFGVNGVEATDCPFRNWKRRHLKEIKEQISHKPYLFHHLFRRLCTLHALGWESTWDSGGLSGAYLYQLRLWSRGFWHLITDRDPTPRLECSLQPVGLHPHITQALNYQSRGQSLCATCLAPNNPSCFLPPFSFLFLLFF